MLQVHTCVSVHCDQCGDSPVGPGFEAHYPSEDAALDAAVAAGWLVGPGGQWWCSACGPVLVCADQGHDFTPWKRAGADQTEVVPGAEGGGSSEYRYCRRCCLHESRPDWVLISGLDRQGKGTSAQSVVLSVGGDVAGEVA
jgi:hypothetical protein